MQPWLQAVSSLVFNARITDVPDFFHSLAVADGPLPMTHRVKLLWVMRPVPGRGIVAKQADSRYEFSGRNLKRSPWQKIKNPVYSQKDGREELFERPSAQE